MQCLRCGSELPQVAHFCHVCGTDVREEDAKRRSSFALKPDEPVASFAIVSSIMPQGAPGRPRTYRFALGITVLAALIAALFGALPVAVLIAAFAMPIVYIVYLYDVNLWEDEPVRVTVLAFLLTAALAAVFLVLLRMTGLLSPPVPVPELAPGISIGGPTLAGALVAFLLVPVVGELIRQIGPVALASRPKFDDLMDGLTFGVIAGVAYSTADTFVRHWPALTGGLAEGADPGSWVALVILEGFVKPLIIGTASGIAGAEFSGLGEGYDGFTPRYFRGVVEAILANALYTGGVYLLGSVTNPTTRVVLQVLWGLVILGALTLRIRNVLHTGLMEAALESAARHGVGVEPGVGVDDGMAFCAACEMPLLANSEFCTNCGTSVHANAKPGAVREGAVR